MKIANFRPNRRRVHWIVCLAALLLVASACLTRPSSPAGRYVADSRIGLAGDFYWELSKGKVALVHEGGRMETFRTYARTPQGWFWTHGGKGEPRVFRIECSWWRLRFYDESGKQVGTMRRRIIPVLRPHWVPDWIQ